MSSFAVQKKKLTKIYPHSNADKLELGMVEGLLYQFCIPKGTYKVGDEVLYFPLDAQLPAALIEQQGIRNFLSGPNHDVIRSAVLRGEVSQGYVASVDSVKTFLNVSELPEDLTSALGVVKYVAPDNITSEGILKQLPELVYKYDLENSENHPDILELLMDEVVVITEKLEGTNMGVSVNEEGKETIFQHENAIELLPDQKKVNTYWKVAHADGGKMIDLARAIQKNVFPGHVITIRAELIGEGVNGNFYKLRGHTAKIFDIDINGKPWDFLPMISFIGQPMHVPIVAENVTLRKWLNGRTLQEASHGKSLLSDHLREGIVIKPMVEKYIIAFGRLILKQRDPIYLAGGKK